MSPQAPKTDLRNLWQGMEEEGTTMSAEQIQRKAQEFLRKNRRDLIARFLFALVASVFCAFVIMNSRVPTVRTVAVLVMIMLLAGGFQRLYRSYRTGMAPSSGGESQPWSSCVEFYRSELGKHQAFAGQPVWQMTAAVLAIAWLTPRVLARRSADPLNIALSVVLFAAGGLIALMVVRKVQARRVQGDMEALNRFIEDRHSGGTDGDTVHE